MKRILVFIFCIALVFVLAACGPAPSPSPSPTGTAGATTTPTTATGAPLVGISVPQAPTGWVAAVQYYADKTAKELGLNYKLVAAADPNEQASQIDELINLKPKIIVLFPANDQVAVAAQKIKDSGIILIDYDRTVNPTNPDYYLAGDNYGMGVAGAKYIAEKLNKKGNVMIAGVAAYGDAVNGQRIKGFLDTIKIEAPDIVLLNNGNAYDSPNAAPESGLKTMTDALQANKKIDGVFSIDDELSVGLYQAVREQNRTDVKVMTGGGGAQSYFKIMPTTPADVWLASALYSPTMIIDCVKMADGLIKGQTYPATTIVPSKIVDKSNVNDYLDPSSPY